ncbi:MAG TPA: hypothetical protein VF852_05355 [Pseudolabrys sp.]
MAAARGLIPQPSAFGAAAKAEAKQNEADGGGKTLPHGDSIAQPG